MFVHVTWPKQAQLLHRRFINFEYLAMQHGGGCARVHPILITATTTITIAVVSGVVAGIALVSVVAVVAVVAVGGVDGAWILF